MKKVTGYLLVALSLPVLWGQMAVADSANTTTVKETVYPGGIFDRTYITLPPITRAETISSPVEPQTATEEQDAIITSSAPPLQYLEVAGVFSEQYGTWEDIGQYQTTTVQDHGGSSMYVETLEIGYGSNPIAAMNGGQLPGTLRVYK